MGDGPFVTLSLGGHQSLSVPGNVPVGVLPLGSPAGATVPSPGPGRPSRPTLWGSEEAGKRPERSVFHSVRTDGSAAIGSSGPGTIRFLGAGDHR